MNSLLSVIIPNYNHAKYLRQRIDSVLTQTYRNFEVIILDDCSTDNSAEIIKLYEGVDGITDIIFNKTNSGNTFSQWKKGIELAKGEFIWIAESDDYADAFFLQTAMKLLTENKNAGMFFSNFCSVDNKGVEIDANLQKYSTSLVQFFENSSSMNGKLFCDNYLFYSNLLVNASGVVFKKSLYNKYHKPDSLKIAGDWCTWVDICYNTDVTFSNKELNFYRQHTENVRSDKNALLGEEMISCYIKFIKKADKKNVKEKIKNTLCKYWIYYFECNKNLSTSAKLFLLIFKNDFIFPIRICKRILKKFFNERTFSNAHHKSALAKYSTHQ